MPMVSAGGEAPAEEGSESGTICERGREDENEKAVERGRERVVSEWTRLLRSPHVPDDLRVGSMLDAFDEVLCRVLHCRSYERP